MKELIGKRCCIVFNLLMAEQPISGYPVWAVVEKVDNYIIKVFKPNNIKLYKRDYKL